MGDMQGRVEVWHAGSWGTVCDDGWTNEDAQVVCRQLGFDDSTATANSRAQYGAGSGSIHYDDVACTGSEDSLASCPALQGSHNCAHSEDAGVECSTTASVGGSGAGSGTQAPTEAPPQAPTAPAIPVRLVGGASASQGRVEVWHAGSWGTVCDDGWTNEDAQVVCRQLGFDDSTATANSQAQYGAGSGSIHYDDVACTGSEDSLASCPALQGSHNC